MSSFHVKAVTVFFLMFLSFLILASISAHSESEEQVDQKMIEAFKLLHEGLKEAGDAEEARAIADKLNRALALLENTNDPDRIDKASALVNEAYEEAVNFSSKSKQARFITNVIIWSLIPPASLFATISVTEFQRWFKEREKRLMLNMVVRMRGGVSDKED